MRKSFFIIFLLLLAPLAQQQAQAQVHFQRFDQMQLVANLCGPDAAAAQARSRTGGRVLSVRPSNDPSRPGFEVRVLLGDGRVTVVFVNPGCP